MSTIEQSIEVKVPVRTAYNQWTQFEDFPHFMEGVEYVKQLDDVTLHWKAEIAGQTREWDAKITEQTPDQRISWTNIDGVYNSGVVTLASSTLYSKDGCSRPMLLVGMRRGSGVPTLGSMHMHSTCTYRYSVPQVRIPAKSGT